jgi:chitinase
VSKMIRPISLALALLWALSGCASSAGSTPSTSPTQGLSNFKIVGYVTQAATLSLIDFSRVTHINYAFLLPRANGTLRPFGAPRHLQRTIELAHEAGARVLISVGGWGWDDEFEAMAASKETRARFIGLVDQFVVRYHLDGVDIDWEYPNAGDSAQNFLALIRELRQTLQKPLLLTTAVIARAGDADGILPEVFDLLDYVNVMAYDDGDADHSTYALAESAVRSWTSLGLPPEKCVLGVPFYARPGDISYKKLLSYDKAASAGDHLRYFTTEQFYNGPDTLRKKTLLARSEAGGIMIWELSQDAVGDDSLLKVIAETSRTSP